MMQLSLGIGPKRVEGTTWTVIADARPDREGRRCVVLRCDCGFQRREWRSNVVRGRVSRSCMRCRKPTRRGTGPYRGTLSRTVKVTDVEPLDAETHKLLDQERPRYRSECVDGPRPCMWASCRYNLYLDVTTGGSIKFNYPDKEIWELERTCALDVASEGAGTLAEVAECMQMTKERARQIEADAIRKIKSADRGR